MHFSQDLCNTSSLSRSLCRTSTTHAASHAAFTGPLQHTPVNGGGGGGRLGETEGSKGLWDCVCVGGGGGVHVGKSEGQSEICTAL